MTKTYQKCTKELLSFIEKSPTAFHAVENIVKALEERGAIHIEETDNVKIEAGKTYCITRGMSSVIAFTVPESPKSFMICASHTDSPCLKLKPRFEKSCAGDHITLDVEKYGGLIHSSWLDRPLSVAGRVAIKDENEITLKTVNINKDLLVIPNVCIHFNRTINDGYKYNPQTDLAPLFAQGCDSAKLMQIIARTLKVDEKSIIAHDLFLYDRTKGSIWGADGEFFSSSRIDNLQCAYATLMGFLDSPDSDCIKVYVSFDNEETGSSSRQGAGSTFLYDTLERICSDLGISRTEYVAMLSSSFMLSADNAHALHPNHPELCDPYNVPLMNRGVVIKSNASQRYTTDAVSLALITEICKAAKVPYQFFANRSDMAGGSTLGNISNNRVALPTADIGLAQLAMHSAYESGGCYDTLHLINCTKHFYASRVICHRDGHYTVTKERG